MQNGIYEEGWSEFSNRFSMNLTKVLFLACIFLFALSFAEAAADNAEQGPGEQQLAIYSQILANPLVRYGGLFLWTCSGLVMVYPKSGAMVWILRKYPKSDFKIPQKASENIKKGYLYQIIEWVHVSYKGYLLIFVGGLVFVFGVLHSAENHRLLGMYCAYPVLEYCILTFLFVSIDMSSYLKWEVPILNEEGRNVSKTVKISDHMLRMSTFMLAFTNVVLHELSLLNICIKGSSLGRFQWVVLLLRNSVVLGLVILHVVMLYYITPWYHPAVDVIATDIVFFGIYLPISNMIDVTIYDIILSRSLILLSDPKVKSSDATAEGTFSGSNSVSSGSESKTKTD